MSDYHVNMFFREDDGGFIACWTSARMGHNSGLN